MSEEKEKEQVLDLPMLDTSNEELEAGVEKMKTFQDVLTPPEGQVLVGLRSFCPIHGDITRASKVIKYTTYKKNKDTGEVVAAADSDILCLACLSEIWRSKVVDNYPKGEDGRPGEIQISPVFLDKEEYEKLVQKAKESSQDQDTSSESTEQKSEEKTEE